MVKITKHYKQINLNTLRLPMDFQKLKWEDNVIFAYNVLQGKNKKKAEYVKKAMLYYEKIIHNSSAHSAINNIQNMKIVVDRYSIETADDLESILRSIDVTALEAELPVMGTPRKMLLGFNRKEDDSIRIFNELFDMTVTARVLRVAKAVTAYAKDGFDEEWKEHLATKFLLDAANEYQNGTDRFFKDNIIALLEACKKIKEPTAKLDTVIESAPRVTKDIALLFTSEENVYEIIQ